MLMMPSHFDSTESVDTDDDGTGDNADTDDDGDGVYDLMTLSHLIQLNLSIQMMMELETMQIQMTMAI